MKDVHLTDSGHDAVQNESAQKTTPRRPSAGAQTLIAIIVLPITSYLLGLLNLWGILNKLLDEDASLATTPEDIQFDMMLDNVMAGIVLAFGLFLLLSWIFRWNRANRVATLICLMWATFELAICAILLVLSITRYKVGIELLADAACIWCINIVIFGIWYWFVDGGGPLKRLTGPTIPADLVFPQQASEFPGYANWQPRLLDYFFLAFNHNMAFSPTDTLILSRRAKLLMIGQTVIALLAFAVALSRAIGIV